MAKQGKTSMTTATTTAITHHSENGSHPSVNAQIFARLPEDEQTRLLAMIAQERGADEQGAEGDTPTWRVCTLEDAYRPRPPVRYIVKPLIAEGSLNMLFGIPGNMKSFLQADLALCVAGGRRWLTLPDGSGGMETTQTPVLWVDHDNGRRRSDDRFQAIGKAYDLPADAPFHYVSMPHPPLNLSDTTSAMMLTDHVRELAAGLVVIDNLGLAAGDVDENSNGMAAVMSNLRSLAEDTGAAVVVIHHQRKTSDKDTQINTIRGHTSISAALDLALHVTREINSLTLIPVKSRDVDVLITAAEFSFEHKPGTNELAQARYFGQRIVDSSSKMAIKQAILECLLNGAQVSQSALVKTVKEAGITAGTNAIRAMIDEMAAQDELTQATGKRGAKLYAIA
jgi:hypothetical protein